MSEEIKVAEKLDDLIKQSSEVMNIVNHFEKAIAMANVVKQLKNELSKPEIINNLMPLQGLNIGFLSDNKNGYSPEKVIECLTEAVMQGVYPTGNEFNIIAGKCYITKNGMKRKLENLGYIKNIKLKFNDYKENGKHATVYMQVSWIDERTNSNHNEVLTLLVKTDNYSTSDNILGKATRKARAWLFENVTGEAVPDGDIEEVKYKDISNEPEHKPVPKKKLKQLQFNTVDYNNVITKLEEGTVDIDTVKQHYVLTNEIEDLLNEVVEARIERLIDEESKKFENQ